MSHCQTFKSRTRSPPTPKPPAESYPPQTRHCHTVHFIRTTPRSPREGLEQQSGQTRHRWHPLGVRAIFNVLNNGSRIRAGETVRSACLLGTRSAHKSQNKQREENDRHKIDFVDILTRPKDRLEQGLEGGFTLGEHGQHPFLKLYSVLRPPLHIDHLVVVLFHLYLDLVQLVALLAHLLLHMMNVVLEMLLVTDHHLLDLCLVLCQQFFEGSHLGIAVFELQLKGPQSVGLLLPCIHRTC
mmetsp:Transcript_24432/g.63693  ORF Transcript_24432/g.63693 Transcript_24432/m.63693 type:complete len:241 (-) Transcript_24432:1575-2297(-)